MAKPTPLPRSKRVLGVVAALFAASIAIRLASGTGLAIAREAERFTQPEEEARAQSCEVPPDLSNALALVQERDAALTKAEEDLKLEQHNVALARAEVVRKLTQMEEAEARLRATIALAETAAEDDLGRLTAVYENMKPKDAAALFQAMAPDFAAGFIGRMRPDAAAQVMTGLPPETAYSISVILAGRNANVPVE